MLAKITSSLAGVIASTTCLTAQVPSVLQLQKSYHLAIYSTTIDVPSGAISLLSESGDLDLHANGTMTGSVSRYESTIAGTSFTPNDPINGTYSVRPDGIVMVDHDPGIPGTGEADLWINADGVAIHGARSKLSTENVSAFAIEKSTGMSVASLMGDYYFSSQYMELIGGQLWTTSYWGIATFDGLGGVGLALTEMVVAPNGTPTTSPLNSVSTYTVAPDGALTFGFAVLQGAVSGDSEVLFATAGEINSTEVGMVAAVRLGTNYDFNNLEGRYSLQGQAYILGTAPTMPQTTSDFGELELAATSATTGNWDVDGLTVDGNHQGVFFGTLSGNGGATIASNGIMSLGQLLELGFSANGAYFVGRVIEPQTNLFFGMRQFPICETFGSGTSGTSGSVPAIGMSTFPRLGNANWALTVADALGGSLAVVAINFTSLAGAPALGGLLWVNPIGAHTPLIVLGGSPGVAGAGSGQTALPLPNLPSFAGLELFAQAVVLDPGSAGGFAMSSGFRAELDL